MTTPARFRLARWGYLALAYACIGLAAAGVVIPGLPVTPFLLVAAWAASRGSERLHRWLYASPHFGPLLRHWRDERAVSRRAKAIAVVLLIVSWTILAARAQGPLVPIVTAVLFTGVAVFLLTRPSPTGLSEDAASD